MDRSLHMLAGEKLVAELKLQIPVDPFSIAAAERIEVLEKPAVGGVSGMFMRVGEDFAIAYSASLDNTGFQRFSVAHELGHYFLPGHVEHVLSVGDAHHSQAGFTSKDPHEREADQFAAGLLLPTAQFTKLVEQSEESLQGIEELAEKCKTSLTATALRFTECTREPIAIVVCNSTAVEFSFMSASFGRMKGLNWLRRNDPIPKETATFTLARKPNAIAGAERTEYSVAVDEWFGGGPDAHLLEEVVGLGRYGRSLTILTLEEPVDDEDLEEEEALQRSWNPVLR